MGRQDRVVTGASQGGTHEHQMAQQGPQERWGAPLERSACSEGGREGGSGGFRGCAMARCVLGDVQTD